MKSYKDKHLKTKTNIEFVSNKEAMDVFGKILQERKDLFTKLSQENRQTRYGLIPIEIRSANDWPSPVNDILLPITNSNGTHSILNYLPQFDIVYRGGELKGSFFVKAEIIANCKDGSSVIKINDKEYTVLTSRIRLEEPE